MGLSDTKSSDTVLAKLSDIKKNSKSTKAGLAVDYLVQLITDENAPINKKAIAGAMRELRTATPEKINELQNLESSINEILVNRQNFNTKSNHEAAERKSVPPPATNDTTINLDAEIQNLIDNLGKPTETSRTRSVSVSDLPPSHVTNDANKAGEATDNISVETRPRANTISGKEAKTDAQAAMSEVRNEQRKGWDKLISAQRKRDMDERQAVEATATNAAGDAKTQVDNPKPAAPITRSPRARAASDATPNAEVATHENKPRAASFSDDKKKDTEKQSAPRFIEALRITINNHWKSATSTFNDRSATQPKDTSYTNPDVAQKKSGRSISYMIPESLSLTKLQAVAKSIATDVAAKAQAVKAAVITITGGLPAVIDIVQKTTTNIQSSQSNGAKNKNVRTKLLKEDERPSFDPSNGQSPFSKK